MLLLAAGALFYRVLEQIRKRQEFYRSSSSIKTMAQPVFLNISVELTSLTVKVEILIICALYSPHKPLFNEGTLTAGRTAKLPIIFWITKVFATFSFDLRVRACPRVQFSCTTKSLPKRSQTCPVKSHGRSVYYTRSRSHYHKFKSNEVVPVFKLVPVVRFWCSNSPY